MLVSARHAAIRRFPIGEGRVFEEGPTSTSTEGLEELKRSSETNWSEGGPSAAAKKGVRSSAIWETYSWRCKKKKPRLGGFW